MIDPVRDGMFVVGDAAGHCLPVSGEGIRPALVFGQLAGRLAERVRLGELTLDQALSRYRAYVLSRKRGYDTLDRLQSVLNWLPDPLFALFARAVGSPRVLPLGGRALLGRGRPGPADGRALAPSRSPWWPAPSERPVRRRVGVELLARACR